MTEPGRSAGSDGGRRRKRFLSPSQKYEIWIGLLRGEFSMIKAADRAGVDRSTIMKLRTVAKQGARGHDLRHAVSLHCGAGEIEADAAA
ncbi:MAG: hypothetical protein ACLP01_19585 [Solirubrobacteraceae bacterium]